ncbi:hypothetical protein NCU16363 [Neurospora crassa OR74A]|uniref:Uncharacterized protein n=1 Tax=Neurospora crassa (strain ATCC 24698 / 74-OR23-1A / CBS 708.71 / DSM 1257 / FGSC 987) TaxID=367110 RepID=V5IQA8_NEUCR|nr:hypothetical protein NCU16363 [Neurospora crassa OR74A]ESA43900.1 hypothetical protein NCU16363 [Neurospora crassa OR74A]|eukprot:XP_011393359.1 hypothetical protein NCU16363 [Neurospora crassa OR74A]
MTAVSVVVSPTSRLARSRNHLFSPVWVLNGPMFRPLWRQQEIGGKLRPRYIPLQSHEACQVPLPNRLGWHQVHVFVNQAIGMNCGCLHGLSYLGENRPRLRSDRRE